MKKNKIAVLCGLMGLFGGVFESCEEVDEKIWSSTSVSYMLTMSPDLLKFVSPEVTYVDSEGIIHTISGVHDLDSLVNVNYAYTPGIGVWTIQTIKGTDYKCWTLNMKFDNRPFHSYMGVKYKRLNFVEDTSDKIYDFHHSIFSTTIFVTSSVTTKTEYNFITSPRSSITVGAGALVENHITFTKNSDYRGEEVEDYLNDLTSIPDKVGFYIDENGTFIEDDDFPM